MVRPALSDMVHTVTLHPLTGTAGADGSPLADPRVDRPAIVDEKQNLVVDQRLESETTGTEIRSSALVFVYLEDYVKPGSEVEYRAGTPAYRRAEVVAAAYYDHPDAVEHAELWLA